MQILMGFPLALDLRDIIDVSMIQPPAQPEPKTTSPRKSNGKKSMKSEASGGVAQVTK